MTTADEAQLEVVVLQALAVHQLGDVTRAQQIDGALFGHACPHARLDVLRVRSSITSVSIPARLSRCASTSPAGPAPTMATCVRIANPLEAVRGRQLAAWMSKHPCAPMIRWMPCPYQAGV